MRIIEREMWKLDSRARSHTDAATEIVDTYEDTDIDLSHEDKIEMLMEGIVHALLAIERRLELWREFGDRAVPPEYV